MTIIINPSRTQLSEVLDGGSSTDVICEPLSSNGITSKVHMAPYGRHLVLAIY